MLPIFLAINTLKSLLNSSFILDKYSGEFASTLSFEANFSTINLVNLSNKSIPLSRPCLKALLQVETRTASSNVEDVDDLGGPTEEEILEKLED